VARKELRTISREIVRRVSLFTPQRGVNHLRTEKYAYIALTAAALIFPCWDQYQEKTMVRVAAQQRVTIGTENPMPMISEQNSQTTAPTTRMVIDRFNHAFNRHDADALAPLLTDDTVFEDTSPAPDGQRIEGKTAVLAFWRVWFTHNADASFEAEDVIVSGDRAVVRWVYRKLRNGQPWHLHGVDVFTVRDGKVAAKLAYVKG
jgi:ketosteroid isomerase-like protein